MSKKVEAIKNMVFYAQQNPERLATLIAGLVTDVATSIEISGKESITVPKDETASTATYTAKVCSQYGDEMTGDVTLALNEAVIGVSISGNVVSVTKTAVAKSFVLKATSNSLTKLMTVELVPASDK